MNRDVPENELLSAYLDGELTAAEQVQIEHLLASDPAARQLLDELRAVSHALQGLPAQKLGRDLGDVVLRSAERSLIAAPPVGDARALPVPAGRAWWSMLRRFTHTRALVWSGVMVAVAVLLAVFSPEGQQALQPPARPEIARAPLPAKEAGPHEPLAMRAVAPAAEKTTEQAERAKSEQEVAGEGRAFHFDDQAFHFDDRATPQRKQAADAVDRMQNKKQVAAEKPSSTPPPAAAPATVAAASAAPAAAEPKPMAFAAPATDETLATDKDRDRSAGAGAAFGAGKAGAPSLANVANNAAPNAKAMPESLNATAPVNAENQLTPAPRGPVKNGGQLEPQGTSRGMRPADKTLAADAAAATGLPAAAAPSAAMVPAPFSMPAPAGAAVGGKVASSADEHKPARAPAAHPAPLALRMAPMQTEANGVRDQQKDVSPGEVRIDVYLTSADASAAFTQLLARRGIVPAGERRMRERASEAPQQAKRRQADDEGRPAALTMVRARATRGQLDELLDDLSRRSDLHWSTSSAARALRSELRHQSSDAKATVDAPQEESIRPRSAGDDTDRDGLLQQQRNRASQLPRPGGQSADRLTDAPVAQQFAEPAAAPAMEASGAPPKPMPAQAVLFVLHLPPVPSATTPPAQPAGK